ncbi:hypothetical protein FB451DRAFT_1172649 [Mycena latifolia]|nr:hypothetical protein FB451DRAFT_1172649 [Mycena latifolia]
MRVPLLWVKERGTSGVLGTKPSTSAQTSKASGVLDGKPLLTAQLTLLNAVNISGQLESSAIFSTVAPTPATALDSLVSPLQDVQTQMASIAVSKFDQLNFANNTAALANANEFIGKAIDQAQNLNCTAE